MAVSHENERLKKGLIFRGSICTVHNPQIFVKYLAKIGVFIGSSKSKGGTWGGTWLKLKLAEKNLAGLGISHESL